MTPTARTDTSSFTVLRRFTGYVVSGRSNSVRVNIAQPKLNPTCVCPYPNKHWQTSVVCTFYLHEFSGINKQRRSNFSHHCTTHWCLIRRKYYSPAVEQCTNKTTKGKRSTSADTGGQPIAKSLLKISALIRAASCKRELFELSRQPIRTFPQILENIIVQRFSHGFLLCDPRTQWCMTSWDCQDRTSHDPRPTLSTIHSGDSSQRTCHLDIH